MLLALVVIPAYAGMTNKHHKIPPHNVIPDRVGLHGNDFLRRALPL